MEDFKVKTNQLEVREQSIIKLLRLLEKFGATFAADKYGNNAYIIQFNFEEGKTKTTLRILFNDETGSDIVITNITTLPDEAKSKGFGSSSIQNILQWARTNNFNEVRATQIQTENEGFWIKNGFTKDGESNLSNDFIYHL